MMIRVLIAVVLALTLVAPVAHTPVQAADQAIVLEALRVLVDQYIDPVDPVKALNAAIAGLRTLLTAKGVAATLSDIPAGSSDADARRLFTERFAAAVNAATGAVSDTDLAYAAIRSMTDSFKDSHTGFLTPQQNFERRQRQRGQAGFTGVGIVLLPEGGKFFVWAVVPGGPAERAGVREFDRIVRVNDVTTDGMTVDQVSGAIRGPGGTGVTLLLQRSGHADMFSITITRAPISVPAIFKAQVIENGIGYIKLYQFVEGTGREFRAALTRVLGRGAKALLLDVRGNSGGFLHELNTVLTALLPRNTPVYIEMRKGGTRVVRTTAAPLLPAPVPLVLLIDDNSASAAELLAAAIKENRRGQLVGEKTAGAVEASIVLDLSDGSAISVTTFRLASGHGVRLENVGVTPNVSAALSVQDLEMGRDIPLSTAVRVARQILALPAGR
ncbi:MAG TPA: S41 family peptidase [bacterium]|jgi:carboxyl-terminal processing protease|nr:S41 family peptidase [bacterium]